MAKTQTPKSYDTQQKAKANRIVRTLIDLATPALEALPADSHAAASAMVAHDAAEEGGRTTEMISALAQIPPFRVGRVTYRVISERADGMGRSFNPVATLTAARATFTEVTRREVALVCRSRSSTLLQHASCSCMICEFVSARGLDLWGRTSHDVWYHDASKTWHVRVEHGLYFQLPMDIAERARAWIQLRPLVQWWNGNSFITDDGRLY